MTKQVEWPSSKSLCKSLISDQYSEVVTAVLCVPHFFSTQTYLNAQIVLDFFYFQIGHLPDFRFLGKNYCHRLVDNSVIRLGELIEYGDLLTDL